MGKVGGPQLPTGGLPVIFNTSGEVSTYPNNLKPRLLGNCPSLGLRSWAVVGTPAQPETADQCEKTQLKSDIEENGFTLALDSDVESVDPQVAPQLLVGNESPAPVRRYQRQDGIALVGRLIGKIKAGVDLPEHPAREDAEHDMRRLQLAIRARYGARFDRVKAESAVLIGCRATKSHKFRVRSRAAVARMGVTALRVRLPHFQHGVIDRHAVAVEHLTLNANLRARSIGGHQIGSSSFLPIISIAWLPVTAAVRRKTVSKERTDRL